MHCKYERIAAGYVRQYNFAHITNKYTHVVSSPLPAKVQHIQANTNSKTQTPARTHINVSSSSSCCCCCSQHSTCASTFNQFSPLYARCRTMSHSSTTGLYMPSYQKWEQIFDSRHSIITVTIMLWISFRLHFKFTIYIIFSIYMRVNYLYSCKCSQCVCTMSTNKNSNAHIMLCL